MQRSGIPIRSFAVKVHTSKNNITAGELRLTVIGANERSETNKPTTAKRAYLAARWLGGFGGDSHERLLSATWCLGAPTDEGGRRALNTRST